MKKVVATLLALMLLMTSFSTAFAAKAGDTVDVTFTFTSAGAYAFDITFDYPEELIFQKATPAVGFAGPKGWSQAALSPVSTATCVLTFKIADDAKDGVYNVVAVIDGAYDGQYNDVSASINKAQVIVGEHVHTEETVPAVAATCTTTGLTAGTFCPVCDTVLVPQEVVPAKGHDMRVVSGKAATCTESGLTDGTACSVCGEVGFAQTEIPAEGHKPEAIPAVEATCTTTGLTAGEKCSVCGEILKAQEEVAVLDHTVEVIPAVEATCTTTGLTAGEKCSVCEKVLKEQEEVEALGHDWEEVAAVEPTYTTPGYTAGKKCTVCGVTEGIEKIPALTKAPAYTIEKTSDTRGKVTYVEDEATLPLDKVYVKITWRYSMANGDTIGVTLVREADAEGSFKLTGVTVPADYELDYIYVEVTDNADADELNRGEYKTYGVEEL